MTPQAETPVELEAKHTELVIKFLADIRNGYVYFPWLLQLIIRATCSLFLKISTQSLMNYKKPFLQYNFFCSKISGSGNVALATLTLLEQIIADSSDATAL